MASFIDDIFNKLFPRKSLPVNVKENFVQSEEEKISFDLWLDSPDAKNLIKLIGRNYYLKKSGINDRPEIHILNMPYANGIAISFEEPLDEESFSNLFFAFGKRMLDLGYHRVSLDRKTEEVNDHVKTTEKQYFKPPLSDADFSRKIDQLFGNVSIEKVSINDKPSFLKVLVTIYSDHLYEKARPFDEFIDSLFEN